jgi:hypothetical protein
MVARIPALADGSAARPAMSFDGIVVTVGAPRWSPLQLRFARLD